MQEKGHKFIVIARNKEITFELLKNLGIPFYKRGKGGSNLLTKILYIPVADIYIFRKALTFKPDIFLSFSSTYAAHASKIYGKPHVTLDDTEHAKFELLMYPPFTDTILNPSCFNKNLGHKQILFNSYIELLYLHKKYFSPNPKVLEMLGIKQNEDFAIVRFVSWNASHDITQKGLTNEEKIELVKYLSERIKVFVSSEGKLPTAIEKFKFSIPPEYMHDALSFACIYVGEGGTTASEAALLGTPAVYINNLSMGYIEDEKKAGLLFQSTNSKKIKEYIESIFLLNKQNIFKDRLKNLMENKINPTSFLVWFIENYPLSVKIMKENPDYQNNFK
jgi:predicted glycosyltransferase